ncbi:MAG: hypothetical protein IID31_07020, partial [Planctomycetes bacterium]|nr:hypothetical protein [Planctomycetota bacterium]
DSAGRRAVLMHELAHLKRRDHYVVWLSQAVSLVYWWHPVVWWACRRIDEEADFACDAWVTSLRPAGRRVYAETLVVAQSYVSGPGMSRAPGLAMASHSARQLSRRLTMVMTQRTSPGLSTMGVILAAGVAVAGMFITPTLACSSDGRAEAAACPPVQPTVVTPQDVQAPPTPTLSLIAAPLLVTDAVPLLAALGAPAPLELIVSTQAVPTSFEMHMTGADQPDNPNLRELLRRIEQLEEALHELGAKAAPRADAVGSGGRHPLPVEAAVRARKEVAAALALSTQNALLRNRALTSLGAIARVQAVEAAVQASGARGQAPGGRNVQPGVSAAGVRAAPPDRSPYRATNRSGYSETTAISYTLSRGKLRALTELMAREDVPVLIERDEDRITVHGTKRQHEIFGAFVRMIEPESAAEPGGSGRRGVPQADRSRGVGTRPESARVNAGELAAKIAAQYASILEGRDKIQVERSNLERRARSLTVNRARLEQQLGKARIEAVKLRLNLQGRLEDARKSGKRGVGRSEGEAGLLQELLDRKEADARAASEEAKSLDDTLSRLRARIVDLEDRAAELRRQGEDLEQRIRGLDRSR